MKSVLKSIPPKRCEQIANGKCSVLVCKTAPKLKTPFKCYIYCTKAKNEFTQLFVGCNKKMGNSKVIGEFVCDRIYEAIPDYEPYLKKFFNYDFWDENGLLIDDCLSDEQKDNYAHGKPLFGWHISDLKIYDKPKELGEFRKPPFKHCKMKFETDKPCLDGCVLNSKTCTYRAVTVPPQSWCYVEDL